MHNRTDRTALRNDLILLALLIALDVAARLMPHAPGVWPIAASALFAGRALNDPRLAFAVPLVAVTVSNIFLPPDNWGIALSVYAAMAVPVLLGIWSRRRGALPVIGAMVASSLVFFAVTNFAVWAFGDLYSRTAAGLTQCFVLALPFLDRTILGDLLWLSALFGAAALWNLAPRIARSA